MSSRGWQRWMPSVFRLFDYSTRRQWVLLTALTGTLFVVNVIGLVFGLALDALAPAIIVVSITTTTGYAVIPWLLHRLRSHVLPSHLCLFILSADLCALTVILEQPWLFPPILATLVPILAVQLLDRRAALLWATLAMGMLAVMIALASTGTWSTQPLPLMGSELVDRAFIALSVPIPLIVLVWFQEESRSQIQAASSFKNTVLASMSHELRTPLNGVLGLLEDMLSDDMGPSQRERITLALRAGGSLLEIVDDALDLMQAESGGFSFEQEPFDLRKGLQELRERHLERSTKPRVELVLDYPDTLPQWFLGDGRQVLRVVDKLVDNGLKFTDRGHVRIRVEHTCAPKDGLPTLILRVEDTGVGIPANKHAAVFERLTQLEDSWDRTRGGTGMGLAVCHELVTAMGGELGLTSQEGKGTELWFSLPMASTSAPEPEPEPEPAPAARRPLRALVVEDNVINQKVAQRMLERLGCQVEIASHGGEAIERVRREHYDIVFMDIQMPVMDGLAATAAIRDASDNEVASLPVVAMTAYTMAGDRERCLQAGMDGFVGKPIDRERLAAELARLTGGGASSRASPTSQR